MSDDDRFRELCLLPADQALRALESSVTGLSETEANARLEANGPNEVAAAPHGGSLRALIRRFRNPLVIQLVVIAAVSLAIGDVTSAIIVVGMVLVSVVLAHFREDRSARAVAKLQELVSTTATVVRDGRERDIPVRDLVPGDVVALHAGDLVPADLRLLSTKDFFVSQSALTGESLPVEKSSGVDFASAVGAAPPAPPDGKLGQSGRPGGAGKAAPTAQLPARSADSSATLQLGNACFFGSNAVSGAARGVVVRTGTATLFGSLTRRLTSERGPTSFDRGIAAFTWLMIRIMVVMVVIIFVATGLIRGSWIEALLFGLAVAVGLTPEMLPMIVTVNLSKGALAMSRKKVIVKHLNSIQNLGAVDVLCTDKTGTITQDRVVLEKHVDVTNRHSDDVLRYAYMNSYFQTGLRNLLDRSILSHTEFEVERTCRKVDEIPFDFTRKRMSVVVEYEGDHVLICKGAVDEVYAECARYQIDDDVFPLIDIVKNDLFEDYHELSHDGYRVLAVAYREFAATKEVFGTSDESDLILLGYLAFYDPPKDSASRALATLSDAGIRVKILTGDNDLVTAKIAADVGIVTGAVVTGDRLAAMSQRELSETVESASVFARLSPLQKEQIIQALRGNGHVVGFMGDGINDAAALRASDVGISVDTAVDIAKEAADIVLLEKSLTVLEDGIVEGRKVFGNIIKYIRMGASSNFGNMFSMLGGSLFLPFLPMTPVQILLNNLLYDVSQTGIPGDHVDEEYLTSPRRWNIRGIQRFMFFLGPISSLFDYATFALMLFFFGCIQYVLPGLSDAARGYFAGLFHTGWFVESLITQTLIVHIIRSRSIPFFGSRPGASLILSGVLVTVVAVLLPYTPIARPLGLVPLPAIYWAWLLLFLAGYSALAHVVKSWFFRRFGID